MRIGWATPFHSRSAIGRFSQMVCEELVARGYDIDVIRIESDDELKIEPLPTACRVINAAESDVDDYDLLIANFGNHAPYHAALPNLVAKRAPLAIFHDAEMRDFEWGILQTNGIAIPLAPGLREEQLVYDEEDIVEPLARPLLGTLAAISCGAVIHGPHYRGTITAYCAGPVHFIPLCYPDTRPARPPSQPLPGRRVAIFGVISEYKQPRRVMQAIAAAQRHTGEVELHLAGTIEEQYREKLLTEAAALGLAPPVFHGYLSDEALQDVLEQAHAICCLRYPVTEGGSASLITALYCRRPLIICDVASYSLVPDKLAYKVSYGTNVADLASAIVRIFEFPVEAEERATEARKWAVNRFSATSYCDALEPFLLSMEPHATLARLASRFVPAISTPAGESMSTALIAAAEVLDWMHASQKRV